VHRGADERPVTRQRHAGIKRPREPYNYYSSPYSAASGDDGDSKRGDEDEDLRQTKKEREEEEEDRRRACLSRIQSRFPDFYRRQLGGGKRNRFVVHPLAIDAAIQWMRRHQPDYAFSDYSSPSLSPSPCERLQDMLQTVWPQGQIP
jgi:hypothetical protein